MYIHVHVVHSYIRSKCTHGILTADVISGTKGQEVNESLAESLSLGHARKCGVSTAVGGGTPTTTM